jgi:hypothetical protein
MAAENPISLTQLRVAQDDLYDIAQPEQRLTAEEIANRIRQSGESDVATFIEELASGSGNPNCAALIAETAYAIIKASQMR